MKNSLIVLFSLFLMGSTHTKEQVTLKKVMINLGTSMNMLNDGIFSEDYNKIEKAAYNIANHAKPKSQLPTIIATLKFKMLEFKRTDGLVHDSAIKIYSIAKNKNMTEILKQHRIIINNCTKCHSKFRKQISKALN